MNSLVGLLVTLLLVLSSESTTKNKKNSRVGLRKLAYQKYNHDTELEGTIYDPDAPINPSRSWARFIELSNNQDEQLLDGVSAKSTGSHDFNAIDPVPGPRGPAGPPGILVLEDWTDALMLLKDAEGDIKRSRKGRYKSGGPVLNIVFNSNSKIADPLDNQTGTRMVGGGFYSSLKVDIYLQRISRLQISNFNKPRSSPTSFMFNSGVDFNHRSGALRVPVTGVYSVVATINLQRMDDSEQPEFADNITARICLDDECLLWDLETRIPILHTKYSTLSLSGIVRLEVGKHAFLFVENSSSLNFKILRSSGFSAYLLGSD